MVLPRVRVGRPPDNPIDKYIRLLFASTLASTFEYLFVAKYFTYYLSNDTDSKGVTSLESVFLVWYKPCSIHVRSGIPDRRRKQLRPDGSSSRG